MIRIILFLTVFTFLDDITTAFSNTTVSPKKLSPKKLTQEYAKRTLGRTGLIEANPYILDLVQECHRHVRVHRPAKNSRTALKALMISSKKLKYEIFPLFLDERENNLSEMDDVQAFFKRLIDSYNVCSEKKLHINSEGEWEIYMKIFGKEYPKGEKEMRKEIFKKRKENMIKHNKMYRNGFITYSINLNGFSDWTEEELKKMNGFRLYLTTLNSNATRKARNVEKSSVYYYNANISVPVSIDWRERGYVNAVKNQGTCGACYAIAGNEALEAYHKKKEGELVRLSAQNILDCTWYLGNNGCEGGRPKTVFQYAKSVGVVSNYYYPYTMNASHICNWKYEHVAAFDEGYYAVDRNNELALWHAVAEHGPVASSIGLNGIHEYRSGVFYTDDCGPVEHSVLVVGYGTDPEQGEYWLVKNCWGFWWGDDGYMRIARNKFNVCNIASFARFPF